MAWTDFGGKPRIKTHVWDGGKRAGAKDNRSFCHPAQKPVEVMDWCVSLTDAQTILDPFMGSGTTGMACANLGRRFIGIELQPEYFDLALTRIRAAQAQVRLFA
jgi:site-specific DNA-methyltransferase (adenine-specific)/modification methylase